MGTEDVTCDGDHPAHFDSKNVGTRTATALNLVLGGADKDNYVLDNTSATDDAEISQASVTVDFTAADRDYNGGTDATVTDCTLTGVIGLDDVGCDFSGATASFADKDVGTWTVTGSGFALSGADKDNYTIGTVNTTSADINPAHLTASITADNKTYDGNDNATYSCDLTGVVGTEDVTCDGDHPAHFDSKNVGTRTATALNLVLGGADKDNYVLDNTSATDDAEISQASVTVDFTAADRDYNGGTDATVTDCTLTGVIGLDDVGCDFSGATASFADKDVGTWTVTGSGFALSGADKDNYTIGTVNTTSADINPAHLTASITADNKTYDGNDNATYSCDLTGVVGTEDVTCDGDHPAHFDSKNVGTRTATALNLVLGGADKATTSSTTRRRPTMPRFLRRT